MDLQCKFANLIKQNSKLALYHPSLMGLKEEWIPYTNMHACSLYSLDVYNIHLLVIFLYWAKKTEKCNTNSICCCSTGTASSGGGVVTAVSLLLAVASKWMLGGLHSTLSLMAAADYTIQVVYIYAALTLPQDLAWLFQGCFPKKNFCKVSTARPLAVGSNHIGQRTTARPLPERTVSSRGHAQAKHTRRTQRRWVWVRAWQRLQPPKGTETQRSTVLLDSWSMTLMMYPIRTTCTRASSHLFNLRPLYCITGRERSFSPSW
jgi:hypothetical protein